MRLKPIAHSKLGDIVFSTMKKAGARHSDNNKIYIKNIKKIKQKDENDMR